jgi:rifampicin phosphotransferase
MLITRNSTNSFASRHAGGKGYNLYLLSRQNLPVPEWIVLSSKIFDLFKNQNALDLALDNILQKLTPASTPAELALASEEIRQLFLTRPLAPETEALLQSAYTDLASPLIAVRSSALDEDSASHSFAGQLSTYLFVTSWSEALNSIRECWASAFSERSLSYRLQNRLACSSAISVAVILQKMIRSEKSGVMFTCDPLKGDTDRVSINSVYGVGEGLVSGHLDGDVFVIDKHSGDRLEESIADKDEMFTIGSSGSGCEVKPVPEPLRNQPSLDELELRRLMQLAQSVESFYRYPQDIEWAIEDGRLYLLQSRPVTTEVKNSDGVLQIFDNSNIVESYGGITLPLSFSFALNNYRWVYVQFLEILMVPAKEIRKMDYFLRNMLALFHGRVYYNLLNWYKLTSILPGFKYNRGFMETMMGTNQSLADEIADRIKPPSSQETLRSKVIRFFAGLKFIYFHVRIQSVVDEFLRYFHEVYSEYRTLDYSRMPADQIQNKYYEVEQRLLLEWKAPIINDYLCMVHFGLLKKLTASWLGHLGAALQNDLLCGDGKLESAEPTRELIRMAKEASDIPGLKELLEKTPAADCLEALINSPYGLFYTRVQRYIDLYGFRCMNEMKLEERDLYQDPSFLFVCLKNYLRSGQVDLEAYEKREKEIRAGAEKLVRENLKGLKYVVYSWSLHHARKAVRNRENTRFCRTRIYGVARAMFNGIGRDFAARGIIEKADDIQLLQIQEIWGAIDGTLTVQDLKKMVDLRREQYAGYEAIETAPRFITRGPVYWQNVHTEEETDAGTEQVELGEGMLKGTGACPGIVEGVVKVILSPKDDLELNNEILVTSRTDPGWIPLYPSAAALLVERGGLLSHSAIVAREMGLPTIVGIRDLTKTLKTGMRVRINGESGLIEILDEPMAASEPTVLTAQTKEA